LGAWARFGGLCPPGPNVEPPLHNCYAKESNYAFVFVDRVSLCERSGTRAERAEKSRERREAVSGSRKIQAEREVAKQERSPKRRSHKWTITRGGKTARSASLRSAPMLCPADVLCVGQCRAVVASSSKAKNSKKIFVAEKVVRPWPDRPDRIVTALQCNVVIRICHRLSRLVAVATKL